MSKCYYCGEMMRDENLKSHCKNIHNAAKRVAGERSVEGFFNHPVSKVSKTSLQSSSSTSGECLLASGGRNTPEDLLLTSPSPTEEYEKTFEEHKDVIDAGSVNLNEKPLEQHQVGIDDGSVKLKEIVGLVKNIDVKSEDSVIEIKLVGNPYHHWHQNWRRKSMCLLSLMRLICMMRELYL